MPLYRCKPNSEVARCRAKSPRRKSAELRSAHSAALLELRRSAERRYGAELLPRSGPLDDKTELVSALRRPKLRSINVNLNIRRAAPPDAALIADFNQRLAAETEQLQLDSACVYRGVCALLNDSAKGSYFVAETDGRVVGQLMITYEWSDWRNGMIWWLQSVYVDKSFRNRGVFRALFRHVENLARQRPEVCGLRLYMHKDNARARASYARLGMSHTHYEVFELSFGASKAAAQTEGA